MKHRYLLFLCFLDLIIVLTDGLSIVSKSNEHVCIIGAGISGLATVRYLQQFGVKDITVYEATRYVGGTWRFDPHVGTDEDGLPLYTSMYKYLRLNTPRETMEFAGYTFPEGSPSYTTGECYYEYVKSFAKHFDLQKYIQFRSLVTSVHRERKGWNLSYTNTETRTNHSDLCTYVVVANGRYSKVKWPKFEGEELFKGKIIHSHDYKDPEPYRGLKVLLVGAGPSGLDLATHLVNVTSKLVHSHHLVYNQPKFSKNYIKKPDIKEFTSNGVIFVDDSFEEVDQVIYCTGFDFHLPFLDDTSGVTISGKFVLPLYQHLVNIRHPSMLFLGLTKKTSTRVLDAQAEYTAALIAGKFELPPVEQMLKSWLSHVYWLQSMGKKIHEVNLVGPLQDSYFANLTAEAGITRAPPVLTSIRDFIGQDRLDNLLTYRDYDFKIIDDFTYEKFYNPRSSLNCTIA